MMGRTEQELAQIARKVLIKLQADRQVQEVETTDTYLKHRTSTRKHFNIRYMYTVRVE